MVDVLGIPVFVKCTSANKSDDAGLIEIIKDNQDVFLSLTYKITILVDNGYHKDKIEKELTKTNPELNNKIEIKVTPKPQKDPDNKGFKPVYKRWVVERSNAWVEKCVSLHKNREKKLDSSEAKIRLCFIRVLVKRLGKVWCWMGSIKVSKIEAKHPGYMHLYYNTSEETRLRIEKEMNIDVDLV